ncbi:GNAT family N-acetyltransferase [Reyranella sp.]|uniref:GNAT family N-acetyltransferase n=1 Tax=Reyranella sp. TaxID=1929291 RepID=UPI003D0A7626
MIDDPRIDLTDNPPQEARDVISAGLIDFNRRLLGDPQITPLALLLTSTDGAVVGGMWARTGFQWLFVELLYVPESLRGRGLGRELLDRAEQEAKRRSCIGGWLETFSPRARALYERCGYTVFGEIPDYPPGNVRTFLSKRWDR